MKLRFDSIGQTSVDSFIKLSQDPEKILIINDQLSNKKELRTTKKEHSVKK